MVKSSNRQVLFRCDGGLVPEIGTGHIARSLALANAFVEDEFCQQKNVLFLTQSTQEFKLGRTLLERSIFSSIHLLPKNCANNTLIELESILSLAPDLVILDRLDTNVILMEGLRRADILVVTFDDRGDGRNVANLAVNAIFDDVPEAKNLLRGYAYLVLPNANLCSKKIIKPAVKQITVSVGGFDNRNLIEFFLTSIQKIETLPDKINIIVGEVEAERYQTVLQNVLSQPKNIRDKIQVFHRPADFYSLIKQSDLVVTAGGLFVFECLMHGIPCIGLPQYPHQLETLYKLSDLSAVALGSVGMSLQHDHFCRIFETVLSSHPVRQNFSTKGQAIVDSKGLSRIMKNIQVLCT